MPMRMGDAAALFLLIDAHALWTDGLAFHGIEGLAADGLLAVLKGHTRKVKVDVKSSSTL